MKIIYLALLLSFMTAGGYAQTFNNSASAPSIIVIKSKWRFQVRNPELDENPFTAIDERFRAQQVVTENIQQETVDKIQPENKDSNADIRRRAKLGAKPVKPPSRLPADKKEKDMSATYIYEIKVKNTGSQTIRLVTFDYIFFAPDTKQEIGRRQFFSDKEIEPGETKNLIFRSIAPPTGSINAKNSANKSSDQFSEQVIIKRIEHSDGTKWFNELKDN